MSVVDVHVFDDLFAASLEPGQGLSLTGEGVEQPVREVPHLGSLIDIFRPHRHIERLERCGVGCRHLGQQCALHGILRAAPGDERKVRHQAFRVERLPRTSRLCQILNPAVRKFRRTAAERFDRSHC
ncbi:hypothetical protein [Tsuneonella sp. SYSU-LHT278]|uniref:hypothetical protein n=1 Tax=Tsuneonella sediminis TaxID=3416089 RepID=UPI003F79F09C